MGSFEPRQGIPFVTIKGELAGTVAAGDGVTSDASGTWDRADGTDLLMLGVAAADGDDGDVISIYVQGIFRTLNDTGAAALVVGERCAMADHLGVDAGTTPDLAMTVVGPLISNADNGIVDVMMTVNGAIIPA